MPTNQKPLDSQCVEILGQNFLTEQLMRGGIEVAKPARDKGVDLIAYVDLVSEVKQFASRPIQLKVASKRSFSIDRKYECIANLLIAFVWHIDSEDETRCYALSYAEAIEVADQLGWTKTKSWANGTYSNTRPSVRLEQLAKPFLMTSRAWRDKITSQLARQD